MPDDEDNLSIGALKAPKEERVALAKKSIDFVCEHCGAISAIAKDKILPVPQGETTQS